MNLNDFEINLLPLLHYLILIEITLSMLNLYQQLHAVNKQQTGDAALHVVLIKINISMAYRFWI